MSDEFYASATTARIEAAMKASEPHLRPVLEAVRDFRVGVFFVPQSPSAFRLPQDAGRPAIVLLGDDFARAVGPGGFHLPSVRRVIRACSAFAIVSSSPPVDVYAAIATTAATTRRNSMLVETRPEQEIQWVALIQKLAPRCPIILSSVTGGHA